MTAVVIRLPGRAAAEVVELPPLVTTGPTLNACDQPIVSSRCASLITWNKKTYTCAGPLAYQNGRWQHVNEIGQNSCGTPQPIDCMHGQCAEPVDIEIPCTSGATGECCGCCWVAAGHITIDDGAGWAPTQQRWAQ